MPLETSLTLYERNTEILVLTATDEGTGTPEDLTSAEVEVYFKTSADIPDTDPGVTKLDTTTGITVTDAPNGKYQFKVPLAVVTTPGGSYWRTDVVTDTADPEPTRRTVMHGAVTVENL